MEKLKIFIELLDQHSETISRFLISSIVILIITVNAISSIFKTFEKNDAQHQEYFISTAPGCETIRDGIKICNSIQEDGVK